MADLAPNLNTSIGVLETRHDALINAVKEYRDEAIQPAADDLQAAESQTMPQIAAKEKSLLGLAALQATKPVPSLILDFKTRHYLQGTRRPEKGYGIHDLLTVERATSKWVYSASGKLTEVPANEPAYQHDPVTGEPLGLLIEESRTNLVLDSNNISGSGWTGVANSGISLTPNYDETPDGLSSTRVQMTPNGTNNRIDQTFSDLVEGSSYTLRYWVRRGEIGKSSRLQTFNPQTYNNENIPLKDAWIQIIETFTATDATFYIRMRTPSANEEVDAAVGGFQLEQGSSPSSYIPTEDAPVTRAADTVYRELGEEFNPSEGTLFYEGDATGDNTYSSLLSISSGSSSNRILLAYSGSGDEPHAVRAVRYDSGSNANITLGSLYSGDRYRAAVAYSVASGTVTLACNGEVITVAANFNDVQNLRNLSVGAIEPGGPSNTRTNGSTGREDYYPYAMTETQLQELTS